ncbi:MAG: LemA family protein [Nanoarchaeota archaeon]|nr:LemA family protein [Nanoarchaeota archaeon]MBU1703733.1 LemA family protein [Nanoarchaeota archaeon]
MVIGIILGVVGALVALIIIGYLVGMYNSLIRLKHNIEKAWSNIDVLLKQRHDELTKLISSVKGYMKFEKSVLTEVTKARTAFMNATTIAQKAAADNIMTSTLKSLFAVAENYPQLKANQNFIQFQQRVSEIENQIADRREFYNDSVNTFNIRTEQIPYVFMANMLHYTRKELFKVAEADRQDVDVQF